MRHFRHFPPFLKASSSSMLGMEKHNGWPLLPSTSSSHAWLKRFSTSEEEGGGAATLFSFSSPPPFWRPRNKVCLSAEALPDFAIQKNTIRKMRNLHARLQVEERRGNGIFRNVCHSSGWVGGAECHGSLTLSGRVFPLFFHPLLASTPETGGDGRRSIAFFLKMQIFFEYFSSPSSPPGEKEEGGGYRSKSPW